MDLEALREAAIEATSRALYEKHGYVPSDDSDEWEDEYRRQFAALTEQFQQATGAVSTTNDLANAALLPAVLGARRDFGIAMLVVDVNQPGFFVIAGAVLAHGFNPQAAHQGADVRRQPFGLDQIFAGRGGRYRGCQRQNRRLVAG